MSTPAHDAAAFLLSSTLFPDIASGTNLRVGKENFPTVTGRTALSVAIENTTAIDSTPFMDGGRRSSEQRMMIMLRVRSDKDDFPTGEALAARLADFFDMNPPPGYSECRLMGSLWHALGPDEDGYPRFTVNLMLRRCAEYLDLWWGSSSSAGPYDAAFITALAGSKKATRNNSVFPLTVAVGEKAFWVQPDSYPAPTFYSGAVGVGTTIPFVTVAASVPGISQNGIEVLYTVRRSVSAGLGSVTIKVL